MMITLKKIFSASLLLCIVLAVTAIAPQDNQKIPSEIVVGLETGNAKTLSTYFNQNVEMVVLDNDNVYSKAQAQQIVSNFFSKFPPVAEHAFSIIHDSGKADAKYVIGKLKTEKGDFRVYFLLKKNSGTEYIHQLRIEKQ
ncbi:DUF4783 domain-containing protein [uncultured Draconibacterium sp.]|uniref:DUF4783 domain-containing protein n=1 Tax=uncultured Draconibacterium sp. TaxID=1573823 RepID=UPI0025DBD2BF|nr:DUF4783 domain-containing protein [uncultured Draconibacterium sp.]